MNNIQFIENDGKREYAILPYPLYEKLATLIEEATDIQLLEDFYQNDDGFRIPEELLMRELVGESPVKLWREYRGLTVERLASDANVAVSEVIQCETNAMVASKDLLAKLAKGMNVPEKVLLP